MNVLHLLSDFGYHAPARQVSLLAPELVRSGCTIHVAALGVDGPLAAPLRAAGVPVHILGSGRHLDPARWWRLRRLLADLRPDVVHTWRLPALRAASLLHLGFRRPFRLVVSEPRRGGCLTPFDIMLLRRSDAIVAGHAAEAAALQRRGVPADRVHVVPLATAFPPTGEAAPLDVPLPPGARVLMCVGAISSSHGFRDAVWAADILKYAFPTLHLVIYGDGPESGRLRRFVAGIHRGFSEVFLHVRPPRPDAATLLAHADVVLVPSRRECGHQVLLETLAAGRPVVASALPGLTALAGDAACLLVPPGDPPALARQTRRLLEDAELSRQLVEAGRRIVVEHAPAPIAAAYHRLYIGA